MVIDFNDVSLYIYGFAVSLIVLCSTIVVGNVDEDSFSVPVIMILSMFLNTVLLSSTSSKHGPVIENVQRISVMGGLSVNLFLMYVFMWDPSHLFCCYSSMVINLCFVALSGATYYHRYLFKTDFMDSRRHLAYLSFVIMLLFPLNVQHDSILFLQCMLFIVVFLGGLIVTLYTEECLLTGPYNELHWLLLVVCAPILLCNRFVSAVVAVIYAVTFIRRGVDQYFARVGDKANDPIHASLPHEESDSVVDMQEFSDRLSVDSRPVKFNSVHDRPYDRVRRPLSNINNEIEIMKKMAAQQI